MKMKITKKFTFEASHRLFYYDKTEEENQEIFGKCAYKPSHGHSYKLYITVSAEELENGMVINFSELKKIVNKTVIDELDHKFLNDVEMFKSRIVTCEVMLSPIWQAIEKELPERIKLERVKLYETEDSCAELIR